MTKKTWKYVWQFNVEWANCGGAGSKDIKDSIKILKKQGVDCLIKTCQSGYVAHTLIEIFCGSYSAKKKVQNELYQYSYSDSKNDEFAWEKLNN